MSLTLTCLRGYPGSGKSTKAREIANETGAVVVCRDDLRMMLHGSYFTGVKEREDEVTIAERSAVTGYLKNGVSVVVDATHLEPSYLRKWAKLAAQYGARFERVDMAVPSIVCITRDKARAERGERSVGEDVIRRMAKRHPISNWPDIQSPPTFVPERVVYQHGLPDAVIFDIDGTLAHLAGRSPYDYSQVHTDAKDEQVGWLAGELYDLRFVGVHPKVLIVSGRDDSCRAATEAWLDHHGIMYDELHMRPSGAKDGNGNKLPDYLVKYDLFNQNIRNQYNVRMVFDDRDQVVALWRALGLKCLQCQPGDF